MTVSSKTAPARIPILMNIFKLLPFLCLGCMSLVGAPHQDEMDGTTLRMIIQELTDDKILADGNVIEFEFRDLELLCIYDETHNRMRIISPIKEYSAVTEFEKDMMMQSNFHSALDARYAVSNGLLYSAFIHPLRSLSRLEVLSAIYQVSSLHISYGREYSSGLLSFGDALKDDGAI